jgi:hypothetical protein
MILLVTWFSPTMSIRNLLGAQSLSWDMLESGNPSGAHEYEYI